MFFSFNVFKCFFSGTFLHLCTAPYCKCIHHCNAGSCSTLRYRM